MAISAKAAEAIAASDNPRNVLTLGWHLDGSGPARYGWAYQHPCKVEFVARTLFGVTEALGEQA